MHRNVKEPRLLAYMIKNGTDVRIVEENSDSLIRSLFLSSDDMEVEQFMRSLRILVFNGARVNVNMKDSKGFTVLHYAVQEPELLQILISNGNDVRISERGTTSLVSHLLRSLSSSFRPWGSVPKTYLESIRILVSNGARLNVDMKDESGLTQVHHAVMYPTLSSSMAQMYRSH